jgi:hypothetical protein
LLPPWNSNPTSPWQSRTITEASTIILFFAYWFRGKRSPMWPGGSLNFQISGIIAVLLYGRFTPSGKPLG